MSTIKHFGKSLRQVQQKIFPNTKLSKMFRAEAWLYVAILGLVVSGTSLLTGVDLARRNLGGEEAFLTIAWVSLSMSFACFARRTTLRMQVKDTEIHDLEEQLRQRNLEAQGKDQK